MNSKNGSENISDEEYYKLFHEDKDKNRKRKKKYKSRGYDPNYDGYRITGRYIFDIWMFGYVIMIIFIIVMGIKILIQWIF